MIVAVTMNIFIVLIFSIGLSTKAHSQPETHSNQPWVWRISSGIFIYILFKTSDWIKRTLKCTMKVLFMIILLLPENEKRNMSYCSKPKGFFFFFFWWADKMFHKTVQQNFSTIFKKIKAPLGEKKLEQKSDVIVSLSSNVISHLPLKLSVLSVELSFCVCILDK